MTTQQIEFGEGRVWSFEASANVTSGQVVIFDGNKVRHCSAASQQSVGVALFPASVGRQCAVMIEGVCRVKASAAAVIAGDLLGTFPDGKVTERTWANTNERQLDVGVALETIAEGAVGKIKLLW